MLKILLSLLTLFIASAFYAQGQEIDSLWKLYNSSRHDTGRAALLNQLAFRYSYFNPDSSIILANQGLALAEKSGYEKEIAFAYHVRGGCYWGSGDFDLALKDFNRALPLWEKMIAGKEPDLVRRGKTGKAKTIGNIGVVHYIQTNYPLALEYFLQALSLGEELHDTSRILGQLCNIGSLFKAQGDYAKAMDYYQRSLNLSETITDHYNTNLILGNIGTIYFEQNNYPDAMEYFDRAAKLADSINDKISLARHWGNIGGVLLSMKEFDKATLYLKKALEVDQALDNKEGVARHLANIGSLYIEMKQYKIAEDYLSRSYQLAKNIGSHDILLDATGNFMQLYDSLGNYTLAYYYSTRNKCIQDSIYNEERSRDIGKLEAKHEYEKQQAIADAERKREAELAAEKEKRRKLVNYLIAGGLVLAGILAAFIFKRFRVTHAQKDIISRQKLLVEQKQKEILDSINYAKRIQQSLLPGEKYIQRNLKRLNSPL